MSIFNSAEVLVLCVIVALFMAWVMSLKKEIIDLRRDVEQLKQVAVTKVREHVAPKKAKASGPPTKLYGVWGDRH